MSIDPVTFMDTGDTRYFNRYAYAGNNPINNTDSTGQWIEDAVIGVPSAALGIYSANQNFRNGNIGMGVVDSIGVAVDAVAIALPVVPGGAGFAINGVEAAVKHGDDVATTVYRAVDNTELADIAENGLRLGPNGAEVKAFVGTQDEASALANTYSKQSGEAFSVIKADIPQSVMKNTETYQFKDVPGQEMTAIVVRGQDDLDKVCVTGVC